MMINRHNYEEFFLLYADDELNHQQRAAVELFVQQNPDMAAELETLLQMKLEPEEGIVFPDKSILFKTTDVEININNYEEFFLLYIDRELDGRTSEKVEKFVLQHPRLQDEFTLLKQTVLQPEAIVFADKSLLYRKEERKVGYIRFARIAAAAALIGLALTSWWLYPKTANNGVKNSVAINKPPDKPMTPVIVYKQKADINPPAALPKKDETAGISSIKKHGRVIAPVTKDNNQKVQQQPEQVKTVDNNVAVIDAKPKQIDSAVTVASNSTVGSTGGKGTTGTAIQTSPINSVLAEIKNSSALLSGNDNDPKNSETVNGQVKSISQTVAYKEIDTNDDDRSMYIGSLDLNKDKIKGFLKRAGRFFGARPKKDTD